MIFIPYSGPCEEVATSKIVITLCTFWGKLQIVDNMNKNVTDSLMAMASNETRIWNKEQGSYCFTMCIKCQLIAAVIFIAQMTNRA